MIIRTPVVLPALCALAAGAACAQDPTPAAAGTSKSRIEYRSAFTGYQPYRDAPVADWRTSNEQVEALKGHAGHAAARSGGSETGSDPSQSAPAGTPGADHAGGHGGRP